MDINFSENDVQKIASEVFGLAVEALEFTKDSHFQNENRTALQSGNARNITYRLGRTIYSYGIQNIFVVLYLYQIKSSPLHTCSIKLPVPLVI